MRRDTLRIHPGTSSTRQSSSPPARSDRFSLMGFDRKEVSLENMGQSKWSDMFSFLELWGLKQQYPSNSVLFAVIVSDISD